MNAQPKAFAKPVDWDELYPGRFLKASDFKGKPVTLTIASVSLEELVGDKGPQIKGVIAFEKTEKQLALNKTNGICLKEMFGKKVQEWVGKRATLFASTWNGEDCVRVYGSPDIDADKDITIALPRKRPFAMKMHKTDAAKAAKNKTGPDAIIRRFDQTLREATSIEALDETWANIQTLFSGGEIPIELHAARDEMLDALR